MKNENYFCLCGSINLQSELIKALVDMLCAIQMELNSIFLYIKFYEIKHFILEIFIHHYSSLSPQSLIPLIIFT